MYTPTTIFAPAIFSLIFLVLLFFAVRGLILWYYKVNARVELLEKNNQLLEQILIKMNQENAEK